MSSTAPPLVLDFEMSHFAERHLAAMQTRGNALLFRHVLPFRYHPYMPLKGIPENEASKTGQDQEVATSAYLPGLSPFERLPQELKDRIYHLALPPRIIEVRPVSSISGLKPTQIITPNPLFQISRKLRKEIIRSLNVIELHLETTFQPAPKDITFVFHPEIDMLYLCDWHSAKDWVNYAHLYENLRDADVFERITNLAVGSFALGISSSKVPSDIRRAVLQCKKLELLFIIFQPILKRTHEMPLAIRFGSKIAQRSFAELPLESRHMYGFTQYPNQIVMNNWTFRSILLSEWKEAQCWKKGSLFPKIEFVTEIGWDLKKWDWED